ncbi:MAG TPA: bifunctional UDP-N-acetylmuramoyl-tripeptide:D-alanyl-D-alanine ligase/alanine racemase [Cyclobacteriaceae bacterium]|nr:bifunctional UDP-N-acetylmuramoyl-tripeptide:D-alanyl-D-alanine ligase/alanine racemase [Cyclobacteriaceae bacterium]
MHFNELAALCRGTIVQLTADRPVQTLLTDSRKAVISEGSVFFALHGDRHDGHRFIQELYRLGIRQFVVERNIIVTDFPEANFLQVDSSIQALQAIVSNHRSQFHIPVIGITGSNGKTIIKEWLFQVLSPDLQIVKNPGSYNSQIGVPLSVWQMQPLQDLGIFEAGISKPGEMENLEKIIQPTLGIFTNLGSAHDEGFRDQKEKAGEKIKLFRHCEKVIYCKDHVIVGEILGPIPSLTWGYHPEADIRIIALDRTHFELVYNQQSFRLQLPFIDTASQQNLFHVIAVMLMRRYDSSVIQDRINTLRSVPMRLELKQGINRCILIDDTYNNDLAGLQISVSFLKNQQKGRKTLILSDILQSGLDDQALITEINAILKDSGVTKFIGIGPILFQAAALFPGSRLYRSTDEFVQDLKPEFFSDEIILVKGARTFQFEKVIQRLQRKVHGTMMEVDLHALVENLNFFKSRLKPGTKLMAMVKAFAYGSGSEEVANLLQFHRIDYLGVAYADEGIELRKNNISVPIMVMNPSVESFDSILEFQLEPEMYSLNILQSLANFLDGRKIKVHLKLDTGMHRLGMEQEELDKALDIFQRNENISVSTVFSHLSGSDERAHDDFSEHQAKIFSAMVNQIEKSLGYRPIRHLLNSSGILRLPQYQFEMVRLGIGLYGVDPTEEGNADLKPVVTLKTIISQIKKIKAGETIGYGRKGKASSDLTLATVAIGYADGYSRSFSRGKGKFLVKGHLAPVVGNVCMDMTMVDVTGLNVDEGDDVLVFGSDLPIRTVANWIDAIPYELLTSTSERVKRVFYAESI